MLIWEFMNKGFDGFYEELLTECRRGLLLARLKDRPCTNPVRQRERERKRKSKREIERERERERTGGTGRQST